ncbi:MAG TPA: hypothetical protein VHH35_10125, partial [Pyrinomonadaceae bacterium]|nr:hypothetical protein [Pyrinomonadaceae bacterium]
MADNPLGRRDGQKKPRKQITHTTIATSAPPKEPRAFVDHVLKLTNHRAEVRALTEANLARLQPTELPGTNGNARVIPTEVRREANLSALKTWHELASARLADLRAGRTGSGPEAQPIPTSQPETAKLMRRLVVGLSKNAARISALEGGQRRWHAAAKAAREGIALRLDTAREVAGESLRPDAQLDLRLAHATFMLEGNSPKLREELKQATELSPKSKGLPYWLARYEIMAGNYTAAQEAATAAPDYPPMRQIVTPMLEPESTKAPWLTWPCNFYTYRYTLADSTELRRMQEVLAALHNDPSLTEIWVETFHVPASVVSDLKARAIHGSKAISALLLWNQANLDMQRSKYASAARNYADCQRSIVNYFAGRYPQFNLPELSPPDESGSDIGPEQQVEGALNTLAGRLINFNSSPTHLIWTYFRERYATLTLEELHRHDWQRPNVVPLAFEFQEPIPDFDDFNNIGAGFVLLAAKLAILKALQFSGEKMEEKIDAPLLAIALVFCPMAMAEANRLRRHFDKALNQCNILLTRHTNFQILSQVIEKPFVKILKAQVLLDKADAQYKARAMARPPRTEYQGLEAAETYQGVLANFHDQGQYVNLVNAGVESMNSQLGELLQRTFNPIAASELTGPGTQPAISPDERQALAQLGKKITIETIKPRQGDFPEPDRRISPHESLVKIEAPNTNGTSAALLETNPLIYALVIQASARLLQMQSGLNYLGYSDEYTPPWRFQFLLDRARYFAEHAKNAQREYLNFLSNAEREEFQELTGAQNVEMEKSNIRVETARVDQVKLELESAKASEELARLAARNAEQRLANFEDFDARADELADQALGGSIASGIGAVFSGAASGAMAGAAAGGIGALAGGIIGGIGGLFGGGGQAAQQRAQLET